MYSTMSQSPTYKFYNFRAEIQELQQEAIAEVVTLPPSEKRSQLGTYGYLKPCEKYSKAVLQDIASGLSKWSIDRTIIAQHLDDPWFGTEAFRLQQGPVLWPSKNCTVWLFPLSHTRVEVELIARGSNDERTFYWDPNVVIHLTEMGLRYKGQGSLRFLYVMMRAGNTVGSGSSR